MALKPVDARELLEKSMRLVRKRLNFLQRKVPVQAWTPKEADEVTGYIRALRGATSETEQGMVKRARELSKKTPEELRKLIEEGSDG